MSRFSVDNKDEWRWTLLIMQPKPVTKTFVEKVCAEVEEKKKDLPLLSRVRFERYDEGLSAQILHVGPYAAEAPTIQRLHTYIHENGYVRSGKHHEIYLNDPRHTAPEKLKTIIRQPVQPAGQRGV